MATPSERNLEQIREAFSGWNSGGRDVDYETIGPEVELEKVIRYDAFYSREEGLRAAGLAN